MSTTRDELQAKLDEINAAVARMESERETLRRQTKGLTLHIAELRRQAASVRMTYQLLCDEGGQSS